MTIDFTALPVSKGDSFLLRIDDFNYLIDGGDEEFQSHDYLVNNEHVSRLHAVICTHNDKDHSNGVIGILRSAMPIDEVWVPAVWLQFAIQATQHEDEWVRRLLEELGNIDDEKTFDDLINEQSELSTRAPADGPVVPKIAVLRWIANCRTDWVDYYSRLITAGPHVGGRSPLLSFSALGDATRILAIVQLAARRNLKIRHFEFQNDFTGNQIANTGFWCWNAFERRRVRRCGSLIDLLALSVTNRNSLVFEYRIPKCPSVLFCADSNFDFMPKPAPITLPPGSLASAPHHGSSANTLPYAIVGNEVDIWVRSDEHSQHRPCNTYRALPDKYCTVCRNVAPIKWQSQRFNLVSTAWQAMGTACQCR